MQVADVVGLDDDLIAVVEGPLQPLFGLPAGRSVRKGERAGEQDGVVALGTAVARPQRHGDRVAGHGDVQAIVGGEFVDALAQHLQALQGVGDAPGQGGLLLLELPQDPHDVAVAAL